MAALYGNLGLIWLTTLLAPYCYALTIDPKIDPKIYQEQEAETFQEIDPKFDTMIYQEMYKENYLKDVTDCSATGHNIALQDQLRIATWNIQKFGMKKVNRPELMKYIVQVILRYDIIAIDEVIDKSEKAAPLLLKMLNEASGVQEGQKAVYALEISPRTGRTNSSYREQYAFFYRPAKVSLLNKSFQYPDPKEVFQIRPFITLFSSKTTKTKKFAMIPIHTSPENAVTEIDALVDVYEYVKKQTKIKDQIILGDFNAGCSYVGSNDWDKIRLYTQTDTFKWLISEHIDSTTKATSCAYDRIVVTGTLRNNIYNGTAKVFFFDDEYFINDFELIKDISDHYPVEAQIRGSVSRDLTKNYDAFIGISVEYESSTIEAIKEMKTACLNGECGKELSFVNEGSPMMLVFDTKDPKALLSTLSSQFTCVATSGAERVISYKLDHDVLEDNSLYGHGKDQGKHRVTFLCLENKCKISVERPTPNS